MRSIPKAVRRRGTAVGVVAAATVLVTSGVAVADNIVDNIEDNGAGLTLTAGSTTGAVGKIRVVSSNGNDGDPECNIDQGESLVLNVDTPPGVTATPSSLTFTVCDTWQDVTFTATTAAVSGEAGVSIGTNTTGVGSYNDNVKIPITVSQPTVVTPPPPPPNTAPVVSVTGVEDDATYRVGSVPTPGCSVTDAEDTNEGATPQVSNGAFDALGEHTVTCSYTDGGQLTGSATATYTVLRALDTTAPAITYTLTPVDGQNGWHKGTAVLDWTVTENESPETLRLTGCDDTTVSSDQVATEYTCSATSEGGTAPTQRVTIKRDGNGPIVSYGGIVSGTGGDNGWYTSNVVVKFEATDAFSGVTPASQDVTLSDEGAAVLATSPAFTDNAGNTTDAGAASSPAFKIDKTEPQVSYVTADANVTGTEGANGWYTSDVTVTFSATDATSGVSASAVRTATTSGEGAAVTAASPAIKDNAGNTAAAGTATSDRFKVDKTAPTDIEFTGLPTSPHYFGDAAPTVDCTATDAVSDVADCTVTGVQTAVGTHTLTATATDNAGNVSTATTKYTVLPWTTKGFYAPVDMSTATSIVYNTVKGGSTVPLKFELFVGATELTDISAIKGFTTTKVNCTSGVEDVIETLATTGGTSLRYDTTAGQFIQNWKTPTGTACYKATMTAQDGSTIAAYFKTK